MVVNNRLAVAGGAARLYSPYIAAYGHTCIQFFYTIITGQLTVKLGLSNGEVHLWSRGKTLSDEWENGIRFVPREHRYFRVIFEAAPGAVESSTGIRIAMDDVFIGECQFPRMLYVIFNHVTY